MKTLLIIVTFIFTNIYAKDVVLKDILQNITNTDQNIKLLKEDLQISTIHIDNLDNLYTPSVYFKSKYGREDSFGENVNDSNAYIELKSNLYNNNYIQTQEKHASKEIQESILNNYIQNAKINLMQKYFDVLLSDLYYQYKIESIVPIFSKKSKLDDALALGNASEIEVFKAHSELLVAQNSMLSAKQNTWDTRELLANAIDYKVNDVHDLENLDFKSYWKKKNFDTEKLRKKMYKNNPDVKILTQKQKQLNDKIKSLQKNYNLNITASSIIGSEPRMTKENDDIRWEAKIDVVIPLYDLNSKDNTIKELISNKNKLIYQKELLKRNLNKKLLNIISKLNSNIRLKEALWIKYDYADLNSEKSRALYEINRKSDLGHSLVLVTHVQYEYKKNEYDFVINNEKLNLLLGDKNEIY
jgi:outer membrane protein TolC